MLKTPLLSPAPTDKVQGMRQSHQLGPWPVNYSSATWLNHGMAGSRSSTMGQVSGVTLPTPNSLGRHVYLRLKGPLLARPVNEPALDQEKQQIEAVAQRAGRENRRIHVGHREQLLGFEHPVTEPVGRADEHL